MKGVNIAQLAGSLAAGQITQDWIEEEFGSSILSKVLAFSIVGTIGAAAGEVVYKSDPTGIFSGTCDIAASCVEEATDVVGEIFGSFF